MVGGWRIPDTLIGSAISGTSELVYDFVVEGTHPDSEFGILDGDFYGPNAEEFAGYFERTMDGYELRGVFGGKRQKDDQ